jgi:predicted DNA-binding antitoxin AbrB/MazE fold protein
MKKVITATYEDGHLKLDTPLDLAPHQRVRVTIELLDETQIAGQEALDELDRLCEQFPIDSAGERLTRDQLHERH